MTQWLKNRVQIQKILTQTCPKCGLNWRKHEKVSCIGSKYEFSGNEFGLRGFATSLDHTMNFKEILLEELDTIWDEDTTSAVRELGADIVDISTEVLMLKIQGIDTTLAEEALRVASQSLKAQASVMVAHRVKRTIIGGVRTSIGMILEML